tara:strand:- start:259 stop:771 length:513 start_codon:yes stop_codon:yes gene_type:complete
MKVNSIDPALIKAYQDMKEQEVLTKSAFSSLDLRQIHEIIHWQDKFGYLEETVEIMDLVENLSGENPDFDKAEEWLELNRDELTPGKLRDIVYVAMLQCGSDRMKKLNDASHAEARKRADKIKEIWATGHYSSRDICAEEEYSGLGFGSFKTARNALINTPDPSPWPAKG